MNVSRAYGHHRSTELRHCSVLCGKSVFANCRAFRSSFVLRTFGRVVEVSVQELERSPTQALAFGVSDEGSERPAVSQAPGTDVRFTVT
jgi:hypothetical protein